MHNPATFNMKCCRSHLAPCPLQAGSCSVGSNEAAKRKSERREHSTLFSTDLTLRIKLEIYLSGILTLHRKLFLTMTIIPIKQSLLFVRQSLPSTNFYLTPIFKQIMGNKISLYWFSINFDISNSPALARFGNR